VKGEPSARDDEDAMVNRMRELRTRWRGVPLVILHDAETGRPRCVNGLHIQTFIPDHFHDRKGTIITFASGDTVTVADGFQHVMEMLSGSVVDG